MPKAPTEGDVQGEGDYVAGRRFQDAEQDFVKRGPVDEKAREAADALDGPEGADLEAARRSSAAGDTRAANHPKSATSEAPAGTKKTGAA